MTMWAVARRWLAVTAAAGLLLAVLPPLTPPAAANACAAGHVALTFDDGPHPTYTRQVLDQLAARKAVATFFPIGSQVAARPALVARMAAEGHRVANHTYQHERLTSLSDAAIRSTVDRAATAVRAAGVTPLPLVRPPYGATDSRVRRALSAGGYSHILWTVDPQDWRSISASTIRSRVLANLHPNAVILLHDGVANAHQTVAALPGIIDGIRSRGYCLALLDASGRVVASSVPAPPAPAPRTAHDFDGDGKADVVARETATGALWLYPGNGRGGFGTATRIGQGWNDVDILVGPGDFNGDGKADLVARETATGALWLHPGDGRGGFGTATRIGRGWNVMDSIVGPGDFNGDGKADLIARETATGALWLYPGNGRGGFGTATQIGRGWNVMDSIVGPGDFNGDGRTDLIARETATGALWLYPGNGRGGFGTATQNGRGWNVMDVIV
jgi:peptidoglycan/xylan/chitin deacetylase (PgdA/CDA1 family)